MNYKPYPQTPVDDAIQPVEEGGEMTITLTIDAIPTPPNTAISPPFKVGQGVFQIFCNTMLIHPVDRFWAENVIQEEWLAHWYTEAYLYGGFPAKWSLITGAPSMYIPFPLPPCFKNLYVPYWYVYPGSETPESLLIILNEDFHRYSTPGFADFAKDARHEAYISIYGQEYHIILNLPIAEKNHPTASLGTNWTERDVTFPNPYFETPSKVYGSWVYPDCDLEFLTESWKALTSVYIGQWIGTPGIAPIAGSLLALTPLLMTNSSGRGRRIM
jgi:hypothetical protein